MSERMIELQRARLLAAGKGGNAGQASSSAPSPNNGSSQTPKSLSTTSQTPGHPSLPHSASMTSVQHATPQQAAAAAQHQEDTQMQLFLHRLQNRNDSRAQSTSAPTVPTALSRRMLQKQGVGFLDDTVAAVVSGAADRFLATVLQQAAACRDQRLKGAEMARESMRHRKRHIQQYEADVAERTRRKQDGELKRERDNLAAIRAADSLKKGGAKDKDGSGSKSKKKKQSDEMQMNGNKRRPDLDGDYDGEESYDSVDEEEEYYQKHFNGVHDESDMSDDEEDDDTLILRDIARPLKAWDFHIDGKLGMEPSTDDAKGDELLSDDDSNEGDEPLLSAAQDDGKNDEKEGGLISNAAGSGTKTKAAEDDTKRARKSGNSPTPTSTSPKASAQSSK